jgi:hypothetical protein
MTRLARALTAAAAVAVLSLASCGGTDSGGPGGGPGGDGPEAIGPVADEGLLPAPCALFTEEEVADLAGIRVDRMDANPGLSECWVDGSEIIIYRFDLITPAAWDWNRSHFEERRDAGPLAGGNLGDDSYAMSGPDVKVLVRTGGVQIAVSHSAFGGDEEAFEASEAIARELLARADLSEVPDVSVLPDIAPCELLSEEEFTEVTGAPFTPSGTPRSPDALRCDFRGPMGELGTPNVSITLDPVSPEQFAAAKARSESTGMINLVEVDAVGDDSYAFETAFMGAEVFYVVVRTGATQVTVEVGQVEDRSAVATTAAQIVLGKL